MNTTAVMAAVSAPRTDGAFEAKALVYPAETVAGYGHVYSLGRAGVTVAALSRRWNSTFRSRYVAESHVTPDPVYAPDAFVAWLVDYGQAQAHRPVLFMADDRYAYIASLYRKQLEPYFDYPYLPEPDLPPFFSKDAMYDAARLAGLALPVTVYPPLSDGAAGALRYPVLVKPLISRFNVDGRTMVPTPTFPDQFGAKAIRVDSPRDLMDLTAALTSGNIRVCVQEIVPGENATIANVKAVAGRDHDVPACFISRKIRQQPADFGTCCVARAEFIPELEAMTRAFVQTTRYTGPCCLEFKQSDQDHKWYFIEVNPRLDYWVIMSTLKGVNLPLQQYLLSTGQPLTRARQRDGGRCWIDLPGDLRGYRWRRRHPEWRIGVGTLLRPYVGFQEAVLRAGDPLPGLLRLISRVAR